eukprot:1138468-Pelagomonas_calceolata.AAC.1
MHKGTVYIKEAGLVMHKGTVYIKEAGLDAQGYCVHQGSGPGVFPYLLFCGGCTRDAQGMHKDTVYNKKVDLVICDEAHTLKNGDSQVTMAVSNLPAVRRLLLSGTPVQLIISQSIITGTASLPAPVNMQTIITGYPNSWTPCFL